MAEAVTDTAQGMVCCICDNECVGPRKLPECGHPFCETCILIRVTNLKDNDNLVGGFPCPSCEVVSPVPNDILAAIDWIKTLKRGTETNTDGQPGKGVATYFQCDPCKALEKSTKAVKRCNDCNQTFCASCAVIRHTHPLLKHLLLMIIDDSSERSEIFSVGELFNVLCKFMECDTHPGSLVSFYCNYDEEYACENCINTKHKDCNDVVKANTVGAEEENLEEEVAVLKSSAENLNVYASRLVEANRTNVAANSKQVDWITETLKAIRGNINRLLDTFEKNVNESAQLAAKKQKTRVHEEIKLLEDMKKKSTLYLKLLERLCLEGSPCQTDIITRAIKMHLKPLEKELLKTSENFIAIMIRLEQNESLLKLPTDINDLIHGKDTIQAMAFKTHTPRFQSRLLLGHCEIEKVKEVSTQGKYTGKYTCCFSYVEYLRNDVIILVDVKNKTCVMVMQTGEVMDTLQFTTAMQSWVCTNKDPVNDIFQKVWKKDKLIAIPLSNKNKIVIISAKDKLEQKYVLDTVYQPKALQAMKNGDIAVAWNNPVAFGIIAVGGILPQTKVYFRKDKAGREIKSFDYLAVDEKRSHVIQPCTKDNAIYCFDFDGNHKFICGSINSPRGVALDADGNVYILAYGDDSLHVISPAGLQLRKIRTVANPQAVSFNKNGDQMAVTQYNFNCITIFKLKKHTDAVQQ